MNIDNRIKFMRNFVKSYLKIPLARICNPCQAADKQQHKGTSCKLAPAGLLHPFPDLIPEGSSRNFMDYIDNPNMFWKWQWNIVRERIEYLRE